ncbi:MAG: hypothetical protein JWN70_1787 [Planctomycetaceae bacterium]|nr:hypothetical protein [Planctomycetaceae bacterium]
MYPRVVCFTLALILGTSATADEKKKGVNTFANLSYVVDNSSDQKITFKVRSAKKTGANLHDLRLVTVKPYGVEDGRDAIYYNTASPVHATFYLEVQGEDVAELPILFNTALDNPTLGSYINPAREHLDVFVYFDQHDGWVCYGQILPNH